MANVNVTLTASLKYTDGTAAKSVTIKAIRQSDPLLSATMATADIIEATSNSSTGIVSLTLKGTDTNPVSYKIVLCDGQYIYLNIPKNAKSCNLGIINVSAGASQTKKNITGLYTPHFLGQDIASATTIVPSCNVHNVTGTTAITGITATDYPIGQLLTLIFAAAATVADNSTIKLVGSGTFTASADDTLTLVTDGTTWFEIGRSVN